MEPTISLRDADSRPWGGTLPPSILHLLAGRACKNSTRKGHSGAGGQTGPRERWAGLRGENFFRQGSVTGWLRAQGTLSLSSISPRARRRGRSRVSECTCLLSVGAAGSALAQPPPRLPAVLSGGVQAALALLQTLVALRCSTSVLATSSHRQAPVVSVCQGRIFPTLHKHYFISCGGFSHLRPLLPPPAPTPSGLLAQFNFHSWYFSPARDNLRWKQFHRLVTHRVIIISIPAPGARAEERKEKTRSSQAKSSLWGLGLGRPFPPAPARNSDFLRTLIPSRPSPLCVQGGRWSRSQALLCWALGVHSGSL